MNMEDSKLMIENTVKILLRLTTGNMNQERLVRKSGNLSYQTVVMIIKKKHFQKFYNNLTLHSPFILLYVNIWFYLM